MDAGPHRTRPPFEDQPPQVTSARRRRAPRPPAEAPGKPSRTPTAPRAPEGTPTWTPAASRPGPVPARGRSWPGRELAPPRRKLTVWLPGGGLEGERGEGKRGEESGARRAGGRAGRGGGEERSVRRAGEPQRGARPGAQAAATARRQPLPCPRPPAGPSRARIPRASQPASQGAAARDSAAGAAGGMVAAGRGPAQPPPTPARPRAL